MRHLYATGIVLAAALVLATHANAQRPDWCQNWPLNSNEDLICRTPDLGCLDLQMVAIYESIYGPGPTLRPEQARWLRNRNGCGTNLDCTRHAYLSRIPQLQSQIGHVVRITDVCPGQPPTEPPPTPLPDCVRRLDILHARTKQRGYECLRHNGRIDYIWIPN